MESFHTPIDIPNYDINSKGIDLLTEAKKLRICWKPDLGYNCLDYRYSIWETGAKISNDRLTYTGNKHWTTALTNGCADVGKWYFECKINEPDKNWMNFKVRGWDCKCKTIDDLLEMYPGLADKLMPNVRIGFGTRLSRLESPIGDNPFGCSISQNTAEIINDGNRIKVDTLGIKIGDIIGCAIELNKHDRKVPDPRGDVNLWPFVRKGLLIDVTNEKDIERVRILNEGSKAQFSVNGIWTGIVINDLYCVEYHPGISTFMGGSATLNLGPKFRYKPPDDTYNPASQMNESCYPCKEDLLRFWLLGDDSVLANDAVINREYN